MLQSLHVKNLALIDEVEVEFGQGLNILTGETGAGKSIIIGSINLALGAKADKEYIRDGAEYALVELVFSLNPKQANQVRDKELPVEEDGTLILVRKIMPGRSSCKVNGENVSAAQLKALSGYLLDMYGQHEHQSLLKAAKHRELLDNYAGGRMEELKTQLKSCYLDYRQLERELEGNRLNEEQRHRELDLLSFEVNEMKEAALVEGEDERLEAAYLKMTNARRLKETAFLVHSLTGYEESGCAGEAIGRAVREMKSVADYDKALNTLTDQLSEIDSLLNDFNRSMADYQESLEFDDEEFAKTEGRLNVINRLKGKYGVTISQILGELKNKEAKLLKFADYEEYINSLQTKIKETKDKVLYYCGEISLLRSKTAKILSKKLQEAMIDLNFLDVEFEIIVSSDEGKVSEEGYDEIVFLISTNPGEAKKPLQQIASGGELSRIMLAFKTVLADEEETDTLIFDEIDTGISGRTAWKVSEKLGQLSKTHQIVCITHLPQIAAMADSHYLIEKQVKQERTVTGINLLEEQQSLYELARLLGSENVTEAVLTNAGEMKALALQSKKSV